MKKSMTGERWIKISEAADYYGVSENTLRTHVLPKLSRYNVPGTSLPRVDRHELDALMEASRLTIAPDMGKEIAMDALERLTETG